MWQEGSLVLISNREWQINKVLSAVLGTAWSSVLPKVAPETYLIQLTVLLAVFSTQGARAQVSLSPSPLGQLLNVVSGFDN